MPPKKRTGGGRKGAAKKQKASNGNAKPSQPHIAIDEGFTGSGMSPNRAISVEIVANGECV